MTIVKETNGKHVTLKLGGWLNTEAAEDLQAQLDLLEPDTESLVLDLAELEFLSSAGLRKFVAAHKQMNGAMTLVHVPPVAMDVLHMAGFDKRLHIAEE